MNYFIETNYDNNNQFRPQRVSDTVILFSHGTAEVFYSVLKVVMRAEENALVIDHGEEGCSTKSYRPLQDVYNVLYVPKDEKN